MASMDRPRPRQPAASVAAPAEHMLLGEDLQPILDGEGEPRKVVVLSRDRIRHTVTVRFVGAEPGSEFITHDRHVEGLPGPPEA